MKNHNIVFFDGVCGLCNRSVDFLLKKDQKGILYFCSLQSEKAKSILPKELTEGELSSMVLKEGDLIYTKSDAAIRALTLCGGFWKSATLLLIIPAPIRNLFYDFVASRRYKIWGKRDECRMPGKMERERFL